jgi:hypothetical protein
LEILPPLKKSVATFSKVEIPYAFKLLEQEMNAYMNMGMRVLTEADVKKFRGSRVEELAADEEERLLSMAIPERVLLDTEVPETIVPEPEPEIEEDDLRALGAIAPEEHEEEAQTVVVPSAATPNTITFQVPQGMSIQQQQTPVEDETDDMPYFEEGVSGPQAPTQQVAPPAPAQQQQGGGGGIHVQTSNQPVLVIPMNVGTPTAPTQLIESPRPGAPKTIAVDTTANAMKQQGLPQTGGGSGGGAKRSGSPSARLNVTKRGGSPGATSSNVVVNVTKSS